MDLDLSGRTALITGGGGAALSCADLLCREGARVILVDGDGAAVAAAAARLGPDCHALHCDLGEARQIDGLAETVAARFALPDIVIRGAAPRPGPLSRPLAETGEAEWQRAWDTEVLSFLRLVRVFAPAMAERRWGRIIAVAGDAPGEMDAAEAPAAAARAALLSAVRSLARSHAAQGIAVNALTLGGGAGGAAPGGPDAAAALAALLCSPRGAAIGGAEYRVGPP
ncbi:SDR family NAD(P)-dependent oxidoreductase [Roseivivax sp. CAU 1761]